MMTTPTRNRPPDPRRLRTTAKGRISCGDGDCCNNDPFATAWHRRVSDLHAPCRPRLTIVALPPPAPPTPTTPLPEDDLALLGEAADAGERLRAQVARVVIGQEDAVRALLAATFAGGHTLLVGVPGLAKTLLVKTLAAALGWRFSRIQFTPDTMPGDIVGMELLQEQQGDGQTRSSRQMTFVPGPIFANLVLADEINRTPPKTQAALLEAMQERQVTSMGRPHPLDPPFIVVATQNPVEQEGTYPLPEAQLDRFTFCLWLDYPAAAEEERIVSETAAPRDERVEPVLDRERFLALQRLVRRVPASPSVVRYAVALARATRPVLHDAESFASRYIEWGAGPRAGQQMILTAKAAAALEGEPAVTLEHVRRVAPHVLRHRVLPNYLALGEGLDAAAIVAHVLETVDPRGAT